LVLFVYGAILHIRAAKSGKLGQARGHPYRSAGRVNLQMASGNSSQESSSRRRAREATTAPLSVRFSRFRSLAALCHVTVAPLPVPPTPPIPNIYQTGRRVSSGAGLGSTIEAQCFSNRPDHSAHGNCHPVGSTIGRIFSRPNPTHYRRSAVKEPLNNAYVKHHTTGGDIDRQRRPGSKLSFSANLSQRSLPFFLSG